jgi:light-regulated signal transduction histidine kinase (bacteriophytochrome)
MSTEIATVAINDEHDAVYARQRARVIAELLGFDRMDQTRISTAVSEIARNAVQYGGGGQVALLLEDAGQSQLLAVRVRDQGPGIEALAAILEGSSVSRTGKGLGIAGTRRLMDHFSIESATGAGTTVVFAKAIPAAAPRVTVDMLRHLADMLAKTTADAPETEARLQNQELLRTLEELRLRDEELVRVNENLDTANKELEAFAYSVSHDLRAPLRHVSGFSELLVTRASDSLDEKSRHYLDVISESVRQMGVLIDDLLQFSRSGRTEMKITDVDMDEAVAEALEPLQAETDGRAIEWTIGALPRVVGDPVLLRQVWANLLGNAVKFTRRRAHAHIEVGARDGNGGHEDIFWVRDDGVGFDSKYAHKLFGVFERLHSAAEFEGTGVGLANVQRIVTRLGGRVWAEGEPDRGATFSFALPRPTKAPS